MLTDGFHDVPAGKIAMVVTDLEMTKPRLRDVPCPRGLRFTDLGPGVTAYRDVFHRVGAPWLWYGRSVLADATLAKILSDPAVHLYTLEKDGRPEALLELDFRSDGECELAYFGLTPTLIGTGAGAYLMDQAIDLAFRADIKRLHLHTCTIDSQQALAFYQRSGFDPVRLKIEIAPDPRIDYGYDRTLAPHVPIIDP